MTIDFDKIINIETKSSYSKVKKQRFRLITIWFWF